MVDWDWRVPVVRRQTPQPVRMTRLGMVERATMVNGETGEFCKECKRLAYCPQCAADLRGKTICHVTMSTHYRDTECKFNGNWMHDYARKGNQ